MDVKEQRSRARDAEERGVSGAAMRRPWPAQAAGGAVMGGARVKATFGSQRENGR